MDLIIDYMEKEGIPMTRENYLDLAFMGDVPDELDPEFEASMPEALQDSGAEGES